MLKEYNYLLLITKVDQNFKIFPHMSAATYRAQVARQNNKENPKIPENAFYLPVPWKAPLDPPFPIYGSHPWPIWVYNDGVKNPYMGSKIPMQSELVKAADINLHFIFIASATRLST